MHLLSKADLSQRGFKEHDQTEFKSATCMGALLNGEIEASY